MHLVSETRPQVQRDRFLRLPEVETLTGLKKSTLYRLMRERKFVQAVQVTPRCTAWPESQVLQWVQDRIAAAMAASSTAAGGAQ
jgi:prophage regulatory protein